MKPIVENLKRRGGEPKFAIMPAAEFRTRLRNLGWSQATLATKLRNNPHTVGKWASGEINVPGFMWLVFELLDGIRDAEKNLREMRERD